MKNDRKRITIGAILCVLLLVILVLLWRLHNGVVLEPEKEYIVADNIVCYRQDDEAWAGDKLGESEYTMKSSGCLVSCIAAAVTMNGDILTPGMLNELFTISDVYDAEGNIRWNNIKELEHYDVEVYSDVSNAIIEACLDAGRYPIVRVRMHGLGNFHYVLVVGAEEGEYICVDPLEDELTRLSDYGSRVYAIRCVWYEKAKLIQLYEDFLQYYADMDCVYAYQDSDGDGQEELFLWRNNYDTPSGYIVKYQDGGLQFHYQKEFADEICDKLEWHAMPEAEALRGIEVCVKQEKYAKYWYSDIESFIKGFGFDNAEPFYEYRDEEGVLRLALYFDEQSCEGCGIRYAGNDGEWLYGFTFDDAKVGEWHGFLTDYNKQLSVEGTTGEAAVEEYKAEYEYDEQGRLTRFQATGIHSFLEEELKEQRNVLKMDYEYHVNGKLKYRYYYHSPWIFGTWFTTWESYFDEQGRVEYESAYITHGSMEYFYIYSEDEKTPRYVLILDDNLGSLIPEFTSYGCR